MWQRTTFLRSLPHHNVNRSVGKERIDNKRCRGPRGCEKMGRWWGERRCGESEPEDDEDQEQIQAEEAARARTFHSVPVQAAASLFVLQAFLHTMRVQSACTARSATVELSRFPEWVGADVRHCLCTHPRKVNPHLPGEIWNHCRRSSTTNQRWASVTR
jgi:hypothetical protein